MASNVSRSAAVATASGKLNMDHDAGGWMSVDLRAVMAPGGALPPDDPFYVSREADDEVLEFAGRSGETVVIKAKSWSSNVSGRSYRNWHDPRDPAGP